MSSFGKSGQEARLNRVSDEIGGFPRLCNHPVPAQLLIDIHPHLCQHTLFLWNIIDPTPAARSLKGQALVRNRSAAEHTCQQAQDLIAREDVDRSTFHFHVEAVWYVAVGDVAVSEQIQQQIEHIRTITEPTPLLYPLLLFSWITAIRSTRLDLEARGKGHYHPDKTIWLPDTNGVRSHERT